MGSAKGAGQPASQPACRPGDRGGAGGLVARRCPMSSGRAYRSGASGWVQAPVKDGERTVDAIWGAKGKRLMYQKSV